MYLNDMDDIMFHTFYIVYTFLLVTFCFMKCLISSAPLKRNFGHLR